MQPSPTPVTVKEYRGEAWIRAFPGTAPPRRPGRGASTATAPANDAGPPHSAASAPAGGVQNNFYSTGQAGVIGISFGSDAAHE